MLLGGSGLGWVGVGLGGDVVRVSQDDADCALRGRPFVCVELNLRRLARGEPACCWGAQG